MPVAENPLSPERQSLAGMLRSSLWASELTEKEMQRVLADVVELRFPGGAYVCRKGEAVDSWPGVVSGLVKIAIVSAAGKYVTFEGVAAGGWFGEGSLLKTEPRRYDAVALRDTRIASVPRATFDWLRANSIPFNHFLLNQLNARLAHFIAMVEVDRSLGPEARVARCLTSLFNPQLSPGTDRSLQISQEEIGHLSNLSRQRVNHALHVLEERGLLRVERVGITVTDLAGLSGFVD